MSGKSRLVGIVLKIFLSSIFIFFILNRQINIMLVTLKILKDVFMSTIIVTEKHRPWVLKKNIEVGINRSFAMRIEKVVKNSKSRIITEKIILTINTMEDLAQLVKVSMHWD